MHRAVLVPVLCRDTSHITARLYDQAEPGKLDAGPMQRPRPGLRPPPRAPAIALRRRRSRTPDMRMTLEPGQVL